MIRISSYLAIVFAVIMFLAASIRNFGDWPELPFAGIQYIIAVALVWGGWRTLQKGSSRLMSAAWGVAVGVYYMAFFSHGAAVPTGEGTGLVDGLLFLVASAGFVASLGPRPIN